MRLKRNRSEARAYREEGEGRTIGDMPASEFFEGMGEAMAGAVGDALGRAGAGKADGKPATSEIDATRQVKETDSQREFRERKEGRLSYGEGARAWFNFERDPEIVRLPDAATREARVMEYFDFHDWAVAVSKNDIERANAIALLGYPKQIQRQLSTAPGSGGALVPVILEGPIIEKRGSRDKITPLSDQRRVSSGTLDVAVEGTILTAGGVAENATIGQVDPTYDPISLRLKKSGVLVKSSREEVMDAAASMQLVRNLSSQAGRALAAYNNTQNVTGDGVGTNYTDGLLNNAGIPAVVGSSGAMTRDTYLDLLFDMDENYTDNLVWLQSWTVTGFASRLEDTSGRAIYPNAHLHETQPTTGDEPAMGAGSIEGIPVVVVPDMGSIVMLANLDFYVALLGDGIRVETTNTGGDSFADDQQWWKFMQRQDGAVSLPEAFRKTDGAVLAPA